MTLFDYVHKGGLIMYVLVLANIISFTIIAWKWIVLHNQKKSLQTDANTLWDTILKENGGSTPGIAYLKEKIQQHVHKLEVGLDFVKITATSSPLLGLLGTVIGILVAFETISKTGLGSPEKFASGIAMALITTAGGLLVAIPNGILYNVLMSKLNAIEFGFDDILVPKTSDAKEDHA